MCWIWALAQTQFWVHCLVFRQCSRVLFYLGVFMNSWSRASVAMLLCSSLLVACSKETEKIIVKEALPPAKIESSAQVSKNLVTFEKASLGKLFLLVPTVIDGSRSAAPSFFRPQLISFERSGDRIAVFNKTVQNNVESVTADQLLQTFAVVEETADKLVFDMGQGFLSMNYQTAMDILIPQTYEDIEFMGQNKKETHFDIKDSFVSSLSIRNNSILMKQVVRVVENFKNPYAGEKKKEEQHKFAMMGLAAPEKVESSKTVFFEIKPYVAKDSFKSKASDSQNRFGFFINNTFGVAENDMKTQIARWSMAPEDGDIRVLLDANVPTEMKNAVTEGVTYWNRVLGRDVLKVEYGYKDGEPQTDRSIVIRWIKWDEGFGAYANAQVDPLTGEAFRGYVYMTSTFTKKRDESVVNGFFSFKKGNLCGLVVDRPLIEQEDSVRNVIAHEMGHVLGLRHNFAGTSSSGVSDLDIRNAVDRAIKGDNSKPVALSSTVMDYTTDGPTLVVGGYIKNNVLSYNKKAIDWAYADIESDKIKNSYCSDEHILEAGLGGREVLGCQRHDLYGNIFYGAKQEILSSAQKALNVSLESIRYGKKAGYKYEHKQMVYVGFEPSFPLAEKLYKNEKKNLFLTIDSLVGQYLSPYMKWGVGAPDFNSNENGEGDRLIVEQIKAQGGWDAYLKSLNPQIEGGSNFFVKQAQEVISSGKLNNLGLGESEIPVVAEGLLDGAAKLDQEIGAKLEKLVDQSKLRDSLKITP